MLCFLLFLVFNQTSAQDNFNIFVPNFIQSNSSFEISIITSNKFPESNQLDIYISPDISLIINKVELFTQGKKSQEAFRNEFIEEYSSQFKKISIDLTDTTRFSEDSFFQIVVSLKSTQSNKNGLRIFGEFLDGENVIGYLVNTELESVSETDPIYKISFDYYQKFLTAGTAFTFPQGEYLNIPLVYKFDKILITKFWFKIENPVPNFLEIVNWETNRVEYSFSINDNQLLIFKSLNDELLPAKSFFISKNIWYHFNIILDKEKSEITFNCGGYELVNLHVNSSIDFENLVLHFQNENTIDRFYLDQLRLINAPELSLSIDRNKNFSEYSDDQSKILLQLNFDEEELNTMLDRKVISSERINFVNSDAPIFPRSPEINVKIADNFYEVNWKDGSYREAAEYILERSEGDNNFIEVIKVTAENDENKKYSLLTEKVEQQEVLYFRIKQINKNGSVVYSDVAKVGQGIVKDAIIGQNYPNPFNPTTLIEFELIQDSDVEVRVYDLAGREISVIHKGFLNKGVHQFTFDGSEFPSGVYLYQVTTPLSSQTRKMILAK